MMADLEITVLLHERASSAVQCRMLIAALNGEWKKPVATAMRTANFANGSSPTALRSSILSKSPVRFALTGKVGCWRRALKTVVQRLFPDELVGYPTGMRPGEKDGIGAMYTGYPEGPNASCGCSPPPTHCPYCQAAGIAPQTAALVELTISNAEANATNRCKVLNNIRVLKAWWEANPVGPRPRSATLAKPRHRCCRGRLSCSPTNAGSCPLDCCATDDSRRQSLRPIPGVDGAFVCGCEV